MPEAHKDSKWFVCPLCTENPYKTWDPHGFWFHLASEHKTSESKLERYVYEVAIDRGWKFIQEPIPIYKSSTQEVNEE